MQQPLFANTENSGSKRCWTCSNITPYGQGFCEECWGLIPEDLQRQYAISHATAAPNPYIESVTQEPWSSLFRTFLVHGVQNIRFKKNTPPPRPKPAAAPKLSLGDLGL